MKTEFDDYAKDYSYGMENPIKKILGQRADAFVESKIRQLLDYFKRFPLAVRQNSTPIKFLDFGCGNGIFLKLLGNYKLGWELFGCDSSSEMLSQAKNILSSNYQNQLFLIDENRIALPADNYDLIVASSVFHHIEPSKRKAILAALYFALKPNGYLIIFEHNPNNFLVRFVVKRTIIDQNAILVKPAEIVNHLLDLRMNKVRLNYFMFFPPRFNNYLFSFIERKIAFFSWGGQYMVVGKKSI